MATTTLNVTAKINRQDTGVTVGKVAQLTAEAHRQGGIISVGTVEETLTLAADITNAGLMYVENLDATNFIDIGYATGVYPNRIYPGEVSIIPLAIATATLYLKADTAACDMDYEITERV